jgi:hypothetical protein
MKVSSRVWVMTGNLAQWIRGWLPQDGVGGGRRRNRGSIGALMQRDVLMTKPSENSDRRGVRPLIPCRLNNFVPEHTEVVLQPRESISYVKFGACLQNVQIIETVTNGLANKAHRDGK